MIRASAFRGLGRVAIGAVNARHYLASTSVVLQSRRLHARSVASSSAPRASARFFSTEKHTGKISFLGDDF
jgi:hypothetical protein